MRWVLGSDEHGGTVAGPDYCATVCGTSTCAECPRPSLWPENLMVGRVIAACVGRWLRDGKGAILGFDYTQVSSVMTLLEVKNTRRTFGRLRAAENEVLRLLQLRRNDEHPPS